MRFGVVFRGSYLRVRNRGRRIEHAEPKARGEETSQGPVQIGFGEQTLMDRVQISYAPAHSVAVIAADEIHAGFEDAATAFRELGEKWWPSKTSVTAPQSETTYPSKPQSLRRCSCSRTVLAQAGSPFERVVRAHHGFGLALHDGGAKRG